MNCRVRFATSGLVVHIGATTPRTSSRVILSTGLSPQAGKACFSSVRRQMDRTALSPLGPRGFDGLFYSLPEGGHYRGPLARQGSPPARATRRLSIALSRASRRPTSEKAPRPMSVGFP